VFNLNYPIGRGAMERVLPGAFDLSNAIYATLLHDSGPPYAQTSDNTLKLWQDDHGLAFEFSLRNSWNGLSLGRSISSGVFRACSVFSSEQRFQHKTEGSVAVKEIVWARISELSICTTGMGACPTAVCWLNTEDSLPEWIGSAKTRWRAGRQARAVRARARPVNQSYRPSPALLAQIDAAIAMGQRLPGRRP
jgi:HK97 family phage prohead protease